MQGYQKLDKIVVRYILLVAALTLAIFNYKLIFAWVGKLWLSLIHISEPTRRLRGSRMPSSA